MILIEMGRMDYGQVRSGKRCRIPPLQNLDGWLLMIIKISLSNACRKELFCGVSLGYSINLQGKG
jgi:hypothetical protein